MPRLRRTSLKKSLRAIERAFTEIEASLNDLAKRVRRAERRAERKVRSVGSAARPITITPKRRAQLKLQGAYMGYMRQLAPRVKAQVKAVKEKKGFEAAIRLARRLANS
jgi:hypothetical protein